MSSDNRAGSQTQFAETSQSDAQLLEHFEVHRDFTRVFLDAFVLLTPDRRILKFNQMFCSMLGLRAIDVKRAETINDLMHTEIPGSTASAFDVLLSASGPMRIDEIRAKKIKSNEDMNLITSSYSYFDDAGTLLGSCILMRDVTAEANLQDKYKERTLQSITDPLTGLFTRRFFEDWCDKEVEKCRSLNQVPALGLLLFDLDKFKLVNDTYGHQAGDFVLAETAKVLRENCRKTDILGRYGGEELLVLLVGVDAEGCCMAAEKFREAIQQHEYVFEGKRIPVTTSVGVSSFLNSNETRDIVIARADKCLYAAKHDGRNAVFADFGGGEKRYKIDK